MKIVFITPAHGRYDLTDIVYQQRQLALMKLRDWGYEAEAIVIAEDHNLSLATNWGLQVLELPNDIGVAAKFNAGHVEAARIGADFTVPVGSDTWLDVGWLTKLSNDYTVNCQRHYAIVDRTGDFRHQLWIDYAYGVHMAIPTKLLASCAPEYEPIPPTLKRGCDTATYNYLRDNTAAEFYWTDKHPLEAIAFRSDEQISRDDRLLNLWGLGTTPHPWSLMRDYYPDDLIQSIKAMYRERDPELGDLYRRIRQLEQSHGSKSSG